MVKTSKKNETVVSMSIRFGTAKLLDLIHDEVNKAMAKSRDDFLRYQVTASSTETTLKERCRRLEESLAVTRSDLERARSAVAENTSDDLPKTKDLVEQLHGSLDTAGFIVDPDNVIRLGPILSTLALELGSITGQSLDDGPTHSPLQDTISGVGELLRAAKRSSEVWKEKCSATEKERDELKAKTVQTKTLLKSKESEIDTLRKEVILLKPSPKSPRDQPDKAPQALSKRSKLHEAFTESSDSDIPLATSSFKIPSKFAKPASPARHKHKLAPVTAPILLKSAERTQASDDTTLPGEMNPPPTPVSDAQPAKRARVSLTPASKPLLAVRYGQAKRPQTSEESPVSDSQPPKSVLTSPAGSEPTSTSTSSATVPKLSKLALPTSGQSNSPSVPLSFKRIRTSSDIPPDKSLTASPSKSKRLTLPQISSRDNGFEQAKQSPNLDERPHKKIRILQSGKPSSAASSIKPPDLALPTSSKPSIGTKVTCRKSTCETAPRRNFTL